MNTTISESLRTESELEGTPLIPARRRTLKRPKTPLPKYQISILMMLELAEAIALVSIYPYINQVFHNGMNFYLHYLPLPSLLENFPSLEATLRL